MARGKVVRMPENEMDPAASTQMFRAFVDDQAAQQTPSATRGGGGGGGGGVSPVLIGGIVGAIVVIALVLWLALG